MEVEVLSLEINLAFDRVAIVKVRYYQMTMSLNVRVSKDRRHLWIEMPEVERGKSKYHLCRWDQRSHSDEFQKSVITQLLEKYPKQMIIPSYNEVKKMLDAKKKESKKNKEEQKKKEEPRQMELPLEIKNKARTRSKFSK